MKLSMTPSEYIIVKATTNSEWDSCNCAILPIDSNVLDKVKRAYNLLKEFVDGDTVYKISFWDNVDFYNLDEEEMSAELSDFLFIQEDREWSFINMEDTYFDKLDKPEQRIDTEQLSVTKYGSIQWKGYGKHTSEEFWTDNIDILELEQAYQSIQDTPQDPVGNIISEYYNQ